MVMQALEITQIQKEIDKVQNGITELEYRLANLQQQKRNLVIKLEATKKRIQKSGIKY